MPHWLLNRVSNLYDQVFQTFWTSSWVPLCTSAFPIPFIHYTWSLCWLDNAISQRLQSFSRSSSNLCLSACGDPGRRIVLDSDAATYPTSFLGKPANNAQWRQTSTAASWKSRSVAQTCATASQLVLVQYWVDPRQFVSETQRSSQAIPCSATMETLSLRAVVNLYKKCIYKYNIYITQLQSLFSWLGSSQCLPLLKAYKKGLRYIHNHSKCNNMTCSYMRCYLSLNLYNNSNNNNNNTNNNNHPLKSGTKVSHYGRNS